MLSRRSLTTGAQAINWHYILLLVVGLLGVHVFFFSNTFSSDVETSRVGGSTLPVSTEPELQDANGLEDPTPVVEIPAPGKENDKGVDHATNVAASHKPSATMKGNDGKHKSVKPVDDNPDEEYVAICLAIKDQSLDLPEFIRHHYWHLGIRRFYIMDDGSDPPMSTYDLDFGVPEDVITWHYQPRETRDRRMQMVFYQQCNNWYGSNHTWIAYLDVDEFLEVTAKNETLKSILQDFDKDETVGALGVHWKMHNSNHLLHRAASVRKSFTTCLWDSPADFSSGTDDNHHIKSIVKTSKFDAPMNPHKMYLKDDSNTVTEHGDVVTTIAWRSPITRDRIGLHHYAVKSLEEFEQKLNRSNAMSDPKDWGFWDHMETTQNETCLEMTYYHP